VSLLLVTAANGSYLPRIAPYLHSIQACGGAFDRRVLVTVGCRVDMPPELPSIEAVPLPAAQAQGHTGNWCVQQGCFLDVLGADDDDVVVFTDGDVVLQREPTSDELAWMRAIPGGTVAVAWNAGPHDTLAAEADRIDLDPEGHTFFAPLLATKVYNVGVVVCRVGTYRALYARYLELWPQLRAWTRHYAANQFLMCAVAHELGLLIWEMAPTVHTHGCFGLPAWADDDGTTMTVAGDAVLFRHHWRC